MTPSRHPRRSSRPEPYPIQNNSTIPGPSLFSRSRNVKIYGGVFTAGHYQSTHHEAEAGSQDIPKIPIHLVRSQDNLRRRDEWTFSIGEADGNESRSERGKVIIQTFVGRRARQLWRATIDYAQLLVNPNLLNIVGTSFEDSGAHYILFGGAQQNNAHRLIASGLRLGERETTMFGTRIVYGIASGLDFLSKINPNHHPLATLEIESFDVFSDDMGKTVLAFTPHREHDDGIQEGHDHVQPPWFERNVAGNIQLEPRRINVSMLNSFITKLFNDANHIIYKEKLDRRDDDLQIGPSHRSVGWPKSSPIEGNNISNPSADAENMENVACRREITWTSLGLNLSLSDISETYEDILHSIPPLDRSANRSSINLPRRSGQRRSAAPHACKRYRREEITFTPDAVRNAILVFEQPSFNEICSQCGQVVTLHTMSRDLDSVLTDVPRSLNHLANPSTVDFNDNPSSSLAESSAAHFQSLHEPTRATPGSNKTFLDFESLAQNYLSMPASKSSEVASSSSDTHVPAVNKQVEMAQPAASQARNEAAALQAAFDAILGSPEFTMANDLLDDFLESPSAYSKHSPFIPPLETPITDWIGDEIDWMSSEPLVDDAVLEAGSRII